MNFFSFYILYIITLTFIIILGRSYVTFYSNLDKTQIQVSKFLLVYVTKLAGVCSHKPNNICILQSFLKFKIFQATLMSFIVCSFNYNNSKISELIIQGEILIMTHYFNQKLFIFFSSEVRKYRTLIYGHPVHCRHSKILLKNFNCK